MNREYLDYLQDILDSVNDIEIFIEGMNFQEFEKDRKTVNAVVRSLEIVGEAAKKVPDEVKEKYTDIPWKNITVMRDKLVHEYFGVDEEIVWKVVSEEIPALKPLVQKLFDELDKK